MARGFFRFTSGFGFSVIFVVAIVTVTVDVYSLFELDFPIASGLTHYSLNSSRQGHVL